MNDATRMNDRDIARLRDAGAVAVLPVGAVEQHGPHLPVDTDTYSATALSLAAAAQMVRPAVVWPALTYGFSPHHRSRPGTLSMPLELFQGQLRATAMALLASGFVRVAFVNGHGGNGAPLRAVVTDLVAEGARVTAVDYWAPARALWQPMLRGGLRDVGHACEVETALQLALRPPDQSIAIAEAARALPPRLSQPWVTPGMDDRFTADGAMGVPVFRADDCGYFGDPAAATAETGHALHDVCAGRLAAFLDWFATACPVVGGP